MVLVTRKLARLLKELVVDVYFSADVETDGPIPGPYSVLSFALVFAGTYDGSLFSRPTRYDVSNSTVRVQGGLSVSGSTITISNSGFSVSGSSISITGTPNVTVTGVTGTTITIVQEGYGLKVSTYVAGAITNATGVTQIIGDNYFDFDVYNFSFASLGGQVTVQIDSAGLIYINSSRSYSSPDEIKRQLDSPQFTLDMTSGTTIWYAIWGVK